MDVQTINGEFALELIEVRTAGVVQVVFMIFAIKSITMIKWLSPQSGNAISFNL